MRIALPPLIDGGAITRAGREPIVTLTGATMGTGWTVSLPTPASSPAEPLDPLRGAIAGRLDAIVAAMSHWEPASDLSHFNRATAGSWVAIGPDFATVMAAALDVAARSDGAFDPAIGALVDLWGFGPPGPRPTPNDAAVEEAMAQSGFRSLDWDAGTRRLRQRGGVALDLSGIAKGYAVDAIGALLGARGHDSYLVEIGGELIGRGVRPDWEPWWVDLETLPGIDAPPLRIALHEIAVATSGDYVRGTHTIDPRTGRPATGAIAVSVVHRSAMWADAWASALAVLAPDDAAALAAREGLAARCLYHPGAGPAEWISPALAAMLED